MRGLAAEPGNNATRPLPRKVGILSFIERLSTAPGVSEFHRATIRGRSPINFTFDFRWSPPGPGAAKKESREP